MLIILNFLPLTFSCFDLIIQLVHLPLSDQLILPLIEFSYMLLISLNLFLQGREYPLLFFHLIRDVLPLGHNTLLLSL